MGKKGDVIIQVLLDIKTDAIINVRFGYVEADTYKHKPMDKLLDYREKQ